ncbi:Metallo-dependent phosphatase [Hypoxylon rubiginosum]|uniref:Metallo-dependent phosphatase n=1 Tax=Hypoxylon rubiginosum TaxID=110542 RepID=A0ACC0D9K5_9PEZI|nr:Metallo-dependent phosphatase [Hypoxylon rubiginosum]
MGRYELPPLPRTQRRQSQRSRVAGLVFAIVTTVLLCYTRSFPNSHSLTFPWPGPDEQPPPHTATMADDITLASIKHPTLLSSLPPSALPRPGADPDSSPHLIIIGDVHGQLAMLDALLAKAGYSGERNDTVVFTGDMINKGPDSGGVIDRAMAIGAYGVRGNHEDKVLRAWAKHRGKKNKDKDKKKHKHKNKHGHHSKAEGEGGDLVANGEVAEQVREEEEQEEALSKDDLADLATAAKLTPTQLRWLAQLPVILRVGAVSPRYGDVVVVHAGLVPGIPLEKQDAWAVMNMRTLLTSSSTSTSLKHPPRLEPSEGREGRPWASVWNELEKEKHKTGKGKGDRTTVVYGHDAKTGLKVRRYAFGLDSNCCRGGDLTALVFESAGAAAASSPAVESEYSGGEEDAVEVSGAKHGITHRLVSVSCEAAVSDDDGKGGKKKKEKSKEKHKDKGKDRI